MLQRTNSGLDWLTALAAAVADEAGDDDRQHEAAQAEPQDGEVSHQVVAVDISLSRGEVSEVIRTG